MFLQKIRRRKTIGRTIKSLRPSNRTNPNSVSPSVDDSSTPMPAADLLPFPTDNHDDDVDVFSKEFLIPGQADLVRVDVSGRGYVRQTGSRVSSTLQCRGVPRVLVVAASENDDDNDDVTAEHRRLSSWRKTICDAGEVTGRVKHGRGRQLMVFGDVDVDHSTLFHALTTKKLTSSSRSLVSAGGRGAGLLQVYAAARRGKALPPAGSEMDEVWLRPHANSRTSRTSWRQSLKSLLKGVVCTKSSVDLWATSTAQHPAGDETTVEHHRKNPAINFRRANSLPRSLKPMKRRSSSTADAASTKCKSVEDQLQDSTDRPRPEVTSAAGERLGRSLSLSCNSQVHGAKSRSGLRPQSMEVHIVAVDELGRPSSAATERRVHVNIPEQPWTKPFANVRLRQRSARVVQSDTYQSSSGIPRDN